MSGTDQPNPAKLAAELSMTTAGQIVARGEARFTQDSTPATAGAMTAPAPLVGKKYKRARSFGEATNWFIKDADVWRCDPDGSRVCHSADYPTIERFTAAVERGELVPADDEDQRAGLAANMVRQRNEYAFGLFGRDIKRPDGSLCETPDNILAELNHLLTERDAACEAVRVLREAVALAENRYGSMWFIGNNRDRPTTTTREEFNIFNAALDSTKEIPC